jgi:hypothetical protein
VCVCVCGLNDGHEFSPLWIPEPSVFYDPEIRIPVGGRRELTSTPIGVTPSDDPNHASISHGYGLIRLHRVRNDRLHLLEVLQVVQPVAESAKPFPTGSFDRDDGCAYNNCCTSSSADMFAYL